jgi:hypothetical protein
MERPAYNNFPKNRNGPGYGGQNQEFRDASRRIICKLRGQRYRNPGNEWLAKFIQEQLFTFDYEETAAAGRRGSLFEREVPVHHPERQRGWNSQRAFLGWLRGERDHCKMVAIPTSKDEDAKRPNRAVHACYATTTQFLRRVARGNAGSEQASGTIIDGLGQEGAICGRPAHDHWMNSPSSGQHTANIRL